MHPGAIEKERNVSSAGGFISEAPRQEQFIGMQSVADVTEEDATIMGRRSGAGDLSRMTDEDETVFGAKSECSSPVKPYGKSTRV